MSWEVKPLGELIQRTETVDPTKDPEEQFTYVDVSGVSNQSFTVSEPVVMYGKNAPSRARKMIRTGDVLFATVRPTLKRIAMVPENLDQQVASTGYFVFRPKPVLDSRYLFYFLLSDLFQERMEKLQKGASYPAVTDSEVKAEGIPLAPLPEQQRIVGKLDAAFAALTEAQAHVERNRANARELFESYLNGVFEGKGDGWVEKRLGDLGETRTGSTPPTNDRSNYGDYAPFVKPGDFNVDGSIEYRDDGVSKRGFELSRPIPANSILMVCVGATIGKTGFVDREVTSNQQINSLTPRSEFFPKYIYYALIARRLFEAVLHNSSQATLPIISKSKWENLTITLPKDRKVQERIANELDELSRRTKELETTYQQKLSELAGLKKAVLGAAFRGEL
jgi:type I restriction enzyme S subunit